MCSSAGTYESHYFSGQVPQEGDVIVEKKGRGPAGAQIVSGVLKSGALHLFGQNGTKFDASDYNLKATGASLVN